MRRTPPEALAKLPRLGAFAFAWWCLRCGRYLPVDDTDHCRDCAYMRGPVGGVNGAHRPETGGKRSASQSQP